MQFGVGYIVSYFVYQVGTIVTTGTIGAGFLPGLVAVVVMVGIVAWLCRNSNKKLKEEYALRGGKTGPAATVKN